MAARDKERYFWLKLHRNFFKRHDIRILENMPNGKELVLLYLKLLAESVDHEGALRFSDTLPYSEEMLASVTGTAAEIVHAAMQVFQNLNLLELQEDGTIFLPAAAKLLDSETYQTKRKREAADAASLLPGAKYTPDKVKPTREKETESEKETNTDKETESEDLTVPGGTVCRAKDARRILEAWNSLGLQQISRLTAGSKRSTMLHARIAEYGADAVLEAIEKIRGSDFLKGQNAKGWLITFEWFVKPNNFPKVLEGNYDRFQGTSAAPATKNGFLELMMEEQDGHA